MKNEKLTIEYAKHFAAYKQLHDSAVESVSTIGQRIKALRKEAGAILAAPLGCDDFIAFVCDEIDFYEKQGRENLKRMVFTHSTRSHTSSGVYLQPEHFSFGSLERASSIEDERYRPFANVIGRMLALKSPLAAGPFSGEFDVASICGLFGAAMKGSISEVLKSSDWPYPDAQPIELRMVRLRAIDGECLKLQAEQSELQGLIDQKSSLAE
jgi:hypothetical protein